MDLGENQNRKEGRQAETATVHNFLFWLDNLCILREKECYKTVKLIYYNLFQMCVKTHDDHGLCSGETLKEKKEKKKKKRNHTRAPKKELLVLLSLVCSHPS